MSSPVPSSSTSDKVVIVGASGYIGKATVAALAKLIGGDRIVVATRNPEGVAGDVFRAVGATVVHGDLNHVDSLKAHFTGAAAVYVIAPGAENRATLAVNGVTAAKVAGVPYVLVLSVSTADDTSTVFGRQFNEVETATKASGVPFTLIRLPLLTDNNWGQADVIKATGKFYGPADPTKAFTSVTVQDAADAAAVILSNPIPHIGKTYDITGPAYSHADLAAAFTASLGKPVEYVQVPYDAAKESFVSKGWPEWQVNGLLEVFRSVDAGTYSFFNTDFKSITGREPTSVQQWVETNKAGF